jgi:hypothetical protein
VRFCLQDECFRKVLYPWDNFFCLPTNRQSIQSIQPIRKNCSFCAVEIYHNQVTNQFCGLCVEVWNSLPKKDMASITLHSTLPSTLDISRVVVIADKQVHSSLPDDVFQVLNKGLSRSEAAKSSSGQSDETKELIGLAWADASSKKDDGSSSELTLVKKQGKEMGIFIFFLSLHPISRQQSFFQYSNHH